jgi:hypothetical protein
MVAQNGGRWVPPFFLLDDPLRQLDNDPLDTGKPVRDTNIELVRQDIGHNADKATKIVARHAIKHLCAVLQPAFVYVR